MKKLIELVRTLATYQYYPKGSPRYAQLQLVDTLIFLTTVVVLLVALLSAYSEANVVTRSAYTYRVLAYEIGQLADQRFAEQMQGEFNRPHASYLTHIARAKGEKEGSTVVNEFVPFAGYLSHFLYDRNDDALTFFKVDEALQPSLPSCGQRTHAEALKMLIDVELTAGSGVSTVGRGPGGFTLRNYCGGFSAVFRTSARNGLTYVEGFILEERNYFGIGLLEVLEESMFSEFVWFCLFQGERCVSCAGTNTGLGEGAGAAPELVPFECTAEHDNAYHLYHTDFEGLLDGYRLQFSFYRFPGVVGLGYAHLLAAFLLAAVAVNFLYVYRAGASQIRISRERQAFLSSVAHELKTPITSIRMHGEMLRSGWLDESPEDRSSSYEYIFQESERLSRLIDNVLRIARLERTRRGRQLVDKYPEEVLGIVRERVNAAVEAAGFAFTEHRDEAADELIVSVDEDAMISIFVNLVDNALKFSAASETRQVDIGYRLVSGMVPRIVFFVRDYGEGIPKEEAEMIFEQFYRASSDCSMSATGTGIGLALVKEMAERIFADVACKNKEQGVEFQLILRGKKRGGKTE